MNNVKVINAPDSSEESGQVTTFPYICHQPGTVPNGNIVFKLSYTPGIQQSSQSGQFLSLQIIKEVVNYSQTTVDLEAQIIRHLLANGEQLGTMAVSGLVSPQSRALVIIRTATKIASDTRRGAGNHIICHPSNESDLRAAAVTNMSIHVRNIPQLKDHLIVLYRGLSGEVDGAPILSTYSTSFGFAFTAETPNHVKILDF